MIPGGAKMRKKVLLVDDVDILIELEKTFFWRVEIELLVARSGAEAIEIIREQRPNLVFLDLHMPGMDGDECCRLVKKDQELRSIPIVMLPHEGRPLDLQRCRTAGCDAVVFKPINRHHFIETARTFLHLKNRAAPRVKVQLAISYGPGESDMLKKFTVNVSTGGVFVESTELHPLGSPLDVIFELPDIRGGVHCRARVAWRNEPEELSSPLLPTGMGLEFLDLSLEDLEVIFAFVKKEFLARRPPVRKKK
jgi:CheY-like chemotaxis protein/Tfp pilus assembly protein PilZ